MLELVKLDSGTLPAIANAIREKTGDTALLLPSQMAEEIKGIQTGVTLPELTTPAAVSDVLEGKEYIGADGEKRTGTLVDQIYEIETVMGSGGISLEVESTAGAAKTFAFPEPNLQAENIKRGISIFNVAGSVKDIRTETGTITPAEDSASLALPCTANPKMFVVQATDAAMDSIIADHVAAMVSAVGCWKTFPTGTDGAHEDKNIAAVTIHMTSGKIGVSGVTCEVSASVTVGVYSTYRWKAGVEYQWTAYYWEDNV